MGEACGWRGAGYSTDGEREEEGEGGRGGSIHPSAHIALQQRDVSSSFVCALPEAADAYIARREGQKAKRKGNHAGHNRGLPWM